MCGFAGIVRFDGGPGGADVSGVSGVSGGPDLPRLHRMLAHLRHRGPDGEGLSELRPVPEVPGVPWVGLVHTRLAIIDLLSGQQPMRLEMSDVGSGMSDVRSETSHIPHPTSHIASLHLVFNGEIYNHRELRQKLEARGHAFRSDHSDTEVLLLGYREWGEGLPRHLHGMYAFAIWDERRGELFLCRDRAGKKPLYLRRTDTEVSFASLVGALVLGAATEGSPESGVPRPGSETPDPGLGTRDSDPAALLTFLRYGYPFAESMVRGITEVPPATWMKFGRDGGVTQERYWRPPPVSTHSSAIGAVDSLREVLKEAVASRLEADVPLGCFLSGGIDSSIIAAFAQKALRERGAEPLRTFSVAMPDAAYDESEHAIAVAKHLGTKHTVLTADPTHAAEDLARLMAVSGEPTADSSILATYWLCKAAREHVKVALSGDGGDELFGGYDRYRAMRLLSRWRWATAAIPGAVLESADPRSKRARLRRLVEAAKAGPEPAQQYHAMVHLFTEPQIAELLYSRSIREAKDAPAAPDWPVDSDVVHAAMRWDLQHYLPFELLRKLDRASMAVALEVRCPLLDTQVADLAGHLPAGVLMPGGRPKGLLRALATELLPTSIVTRPKRGFALPIGKWFRTTLRDPLAAALEGEALARLGIARDPVTRLFNEHTSGDADHTHRLFALWQLALWSDWLRSPTAPAPC